MAGYIATGTKIHREECSTKPKYGSSIRNADDAIESATAWGLNPCKVCFKGVSGHAFAKRLAERRGRAFVK